MARKTSPKIVTSTASENVLTAGTGETHQFVSLNITVPVAVATAYRCVVSYYNGTTDTVIASVEIPVYDPATSGAFYTTSIQIPYLFIQDSHTLRVKNSAATETHFLLSTLY